MKLASLALLAATCGLAATRFTYWIEPCSDPASACLPGDPELARWALQAWAQASGGSLELVEVPERAKAQIRVLWVAGNRGLYGEAVPITVDGKPGAEVHVRPDLAQLGLDFAARGQRDPLIRETIVYLTCLHETGHAIGLRHTANFDDIMYTFQFGGDIVEYFERYRRKLASRADIRKHPGLSARELARLPALF
ncbi:MAG: matrixin family metalloprotease [Acidobacteria bacterium]|nr:matrixin family metalloprotease [Acidobacteriota bacterium]